MLPFQFESWANFFHPNELPPRSAVAAVDGGVRYDGPGNSCVNVVLDVKYRDAQKAMPWVPRMCPNGWVACQ